MEGVVAEAPARLEVGASLAHMPDASADEANVEGSAFDPVQLERVLDPLAGHTPLDFLKLSREHRVPRHHAAGCGEGDQQGNQ